MLGYLVAVPLRGTLACAVPSSMLSPTS